ncbi:XRE family transcriptional regulator [Dokdonella koreensis DS-123]|uniref:XRE family transcriptional regulator n=1 Tax=Dokdonella koreensis DS-123 TaxID=1300342 RepID=A0A160DWX4_9GAMM|nr:XRE family transcriptional regulator [Dokdonella koreensis DS-123]
MDLSQEDLAADLGVSRGAVAQWEMVEGTCPNVENLIALARRTGLAFEYLATGRGPKIQGQPIDAIADDDSPYAMLSPQQAALLEWFDRLGKRQQAGLFDLVGIGRRGGTKS